MKKVLLTPEERDRLLPFMSFAQHDDALLGASLTLAFCMVEASLLKDDAKRVAAAVVRMQALTEVVRCRMLELGEAALARADEEIERGRH